MLGKDKAICSTCASTSVTTDSQVEQCRQKVISVFNDLGITGIPLTIPISMKPTDEMDGTLGHIYYYKTRKPSLADFHIFMTYGLPKLYFQGVLAHEMLHSWLVLYGREVTNDENEGFCNLGKAFIYTKDDVQNIKPNPEVYYKILEDFNANKDDCLIIEDSLIGVDTAYNIGIDCVALYDKYADNDRAQINEKSKYQVNNFKELLGYLERII